MLGKLLFLKARARPKFSLSLSLSTCHNGVIYIGMINGVLISVCDLSFCREGMFMVLGSSILGWNTQTTHLKDRTDNQVCDCLLICFNRFTIENEIELK